MAEVDGFEPPNMGVKTPCLTAWQYLNVEALPGVEPGTNGYKALVLPLNYRATKKERVFIPLQTLI